MKKIKSPYYAIFWIVIWTMALIWFLSSEKFNTTENVGLIIVWSVMVGATVYVLFQNLKAQKAVRQLAKRVQPAKPSLNALCPCGSGKKFKRCCGAS
jgi:TRAP-type C4-dicarboxylate transport system permease large subunit